MFELHPPKVAGQASDINGLVIRGMSGGPIVAVEGTTEGPIITDRAPGLTFAWDGPC